MGTRLASARLRVAVRDSHYWILAKEWLPVLAARSVEIGYGCCGFRGDFVVLLDTYEAEGLAVPKFSIPLPWKMVLDPRTLLQVRLAKIDY